MLCGDRKYLSIGELIPLALHFEVLGRVDQGHPSQVRGFEFASENVEIYEEKTAVLRT